MTDMDRADVLGATSRKEGGKSQYVDEVKRKKKEKREAGVEVVPYPPPKSNAALSSFGCDQKSH
jgi:hypothetical protein